MKSQEEEVVDLFNASAIISRSTYEKFTEPETKENNENITTNLLVAFGPLIVNTFRSVP